MTIGSIVAQRFNELGLELDELNVHISRDLKVNNGADHALRVHRLREGMLFRRPLQKNSRSLVTIHCY